MSTILRKRLSAGWTGMPNETIRDRSISFRATGLLAFLLSMDDGWSMDSRIVAARKGREGRDAVRTAMKELRAAGYVKLENARSPDTGQFQTEIVVSDVPMFTGLFAVESPAPDNPAPGEPAPADPPLAGRAPDPQAVKEVPSKEKLEKLFGPSSDEEVPDAPGTVADRARGCRLTRDFVVTDEMQSWAMEEWPQVNWSFETERFIDYWCGAAGARARKVDWQATWRNWIRKAAEDQPRTRASRADAQITTDQTPGRVAL